MKLSDVRNEWRRLQFLVQNNLDNYVKDRMRDYLYIDQLKKQTKDLNKLIDANYKYIDQLHEERKAKEDEYHWRPDQTD